ncbi:hypothetical protein HBI56_016160 [Parastagonospora nodorum]|nr:hypothetical protein HBH51_074940 [Parastagonospora nodorum]KAH4069224.1 hypothetical protein HBH50_110480 [Parastagonospora nodorum]KAH4088294.1 hypothetical protein HBH48_127450 [Parastagonospora nodorum]KAH4133490.1 hypothetical protein HBH47_010660 [Parastagonospora nodorum]KAH4237774.1 hypothetical protein HBI05_125450 [Parastagonospora nodorum]
MHTTIIIASLFAAFAAAAPADIDARQATTVRVQLSQDSTDTAVQANIPANGQKISIKANFGNLGANVSANRALVVGSSKSGTCNIFKDAAATQRVATIKAGADDARFTAVNLVNGVIVCQV